MSGGHNPFETVEALESPRCFVHTCGTRLKAARKCDKEQKNQRDMLDLDCCSVHGRSTDQGGQRLFSGAGCEVDIGWINFQKLQKIK
jgi:hypothetical protein